MSPLPSRAIAPLAPPADRGQTVVDPIPVDPIPVDPIPVDPIPVTMNDGFGAIGRTGANSRCAPTVAIALGAIAPCWSSGGDHAVIEILCVSINAMAQPEWRLSPVDPGHR